MAKGKNQLFSPRTDCIVTVKNPLPRNSNKYNNNNYNDTLPLEGTSQGSIVIIRGGRGRKAMGSSSFKRGFGDLEGESNGSVVLIKYNKYNNYNLENNKNSRRGEEEEGNQQRDTPLTSRHPLSRDMKVMVGGREIVS